MLSRVQPLQKSQIYLIKRSKQPDHLFNLLEKNKSRQLTTILNADQQQKDKIKKQMLQKRIDSILKNESKKPQVSQPVPYIKKKWISPLSQLSENQAIDPFSQKKQRQIMMIRQHKQEVQKIVKVLDINKKLKYFGQYLQVNFQSEDKVQVAKLTERQSKFNYLSKKYKQIQKKRKPKLCIMNYTAQQKVIFINFLEEDQFYQNIMRKDDRQLMQMLIQALQINGSFTVTSFLTFYDIFVWQCAQKTSQIQFVCKLLMGQTKQRSIVEIAKVVDAICRKIYIQNFNKSLDNFNEVMKKLLFGDDYDYVDRKQYHMTRKALVESLDRNEECISIFINIFYAS